MNETLSTAIATQLAILPLVSPASGFTYKYDSASGGFVRTTTSFGPVYTERAETIGRGKLSFGLSYQRFRFNSLDGIDLHNIPAVFSHIPNTGGVPGFVETYESDVIRTVNSITLNLDQTTLYGTVGVTDRVDISVSVPIVSTRLSASSNANIVQVSGPTFVPAPGAPSTGNPHAFNNGGQQKVYPNSGSASGIGDVTFRVKANILQTDSVRIALAADIRTPTGDALSLLGSGATGIKPFIAVSSGKRFSPHLNLGYQWNGSSILAGDVTGTTFGETGGLGSKTTFQTGPALKHSLPSLLFYSIGADVGATNRLTFAFDYLGQFLFNAPRVFQSVFITQNIPGGTGSLTLDNITGGKDNVGLNNAAVGLKYNLAGNLLLTANVVFRLDNKGLRQDVTPLIGLSYAFGK